MESALEEGCKAIWRSALFAAFLFGQTSPLAQGQEKELETPYVPPQQAVVNRMLELAEVKPGDTVIDLGSGNGSVMITAAQQYGARGFGVELNPRLVQSSNEEARRAGVAGRIRFLQQDLLKTDFREADVLTLYSLPEVNMALRPKIVAELKPGTRVVSHDHDMGGWRPDAEETVAAADKMLGANKETRVYLWIVPAKVEGAWEIEIKVGGKTRSLPFALKQQYQMVSGSVTVPGNAAAPILEGRLRGDEIRLVLPGGTVARDRVELVGRVAGDSVSGSVLRAGREIATWSAWRRS
jgi:SAM-dependent methyltransferase